MEVNKMFIASIVHVGYEASGEDVKKSIVDVVDVVVNLEKSVLNPRPYTAFRFNHSALCEEDIRRFSHDKQFSQEQKRLAVEGGKPLYEWFSARREKEKLFIVKKIHVKANNVKDFWKNLVVLEGHIDGEPTYMTVNKHDFKPIQVKRMVNSNAQPHISSHILEPTLQIPVKAYCFTTEGFGKGSFSN